MTTGQLAEHLAHAFCRNRNRLSRQDWDVAEEVLRRVRQHEQLLADVLPDLRNRLTSAEQLLTTAFTPPKL